MKKKTSSYKNYKIKIGLKKGTIKYKYPWEIKNKMEPEDKEISK